MAESFEDGGQQRTIESTPAGNVFAEAYDVPMTGNPEGHNTNGASEPAHLDLRETPYNSPDGEPKPRELEQLNAGDRPARRTLPTPAPQPTPMRPLSEQQQQNLQALEGIINSFRNYFERTGRTAQTLAR